MTGGGWRRLRVGGLTREVSLAVAVLGVDLLVQWEPGAVHGLAAQLAVAGYAALGYAALIWRRRAPLIVFGVLWLHAVVAALAIAGLRPTFGLLVALFTVAARRDAAVAAAALVAALVPAGLAVAEEVRTAPAGDALVIGVALFSLINLAAFGLGRWASLVQARAADLERRRREAAREAVAAERARIALELHDIVAHAVTVMVLQAGGAHRVLRAEPERAEEALGQVERMGVAAIGELRRMLGALDGADTHDAHVRLTDLPALLEALRRGGLGIEQREEGEPVELDGSTSLTAYRVVQEALTNVAKHAGTSASAVVALAWSPSGLTVRVTNDAGADPAGALGTGTGRGLLGMRERVAVAGGRFSADRLPGGGFAVTAELPAGGADMSTLENEGAVAGGAGADRHR